MAYDPSNLSALHYANGFTMWHYKSRDDGLVAMTHPEMDYFNPASGLLRVGDLLILNASADTQPEHATAFVIHNNHGIVRIELAGPVCSFPRS
jgi:hypothetical protein